MSGTNGGDAPPIDKATLPPVLTTESPFDTLYGLETLDCTDEMCRGRVAVERRVLQPTGVIHGGVYAAMAEALASMGTNQRVAHDGMVALGLSNNTSFLRPVSQGHIHGVARARHRGRTTWIWDVDLSDDHDRLCAVSRVTIAVRPESG